MSSSSVVLCQASSSLLASPPEVLLTSVPFYFQRLLRVLPQFTTARILACCPFLPFGQLTFQLYLSSLLCPRSVRCAVPLVMPTFSLCLAFPCLFLLLLTYAHEGLGLSLRSTMSVPKVQGFGLQHVTQKTVLKPTHGASKF